MTPSSSPSSRMPVGPYWYENLGEDEFQKLCQVLITSKFDKVTCYPVGQKDGGRDITRKSPGGEVVYQVKWSKGGVRSPLNWLMRAVTRESANIKARVRAGATRYVLMTSVSGTAAAATGPHGYGAGTIDKVDTTLADYATEYGLRSMECWWRDDLDALVPKLPRSVLWRFQKMLAGPEAIRFLLEADQTEALDTKLARLIRKVVGAQWSQDVKVKFKQAELDNDDLEDLFIDVKAHATTISVDIAPAGTRAVSDSKGIGAVEYLLSSDKPFTLVRGEPGQGKSTLGQYLSQVYRSEFIPDEPGAKTKRPTPKPRSSRVPLRIDLRDYGTWLDGSDPFDESNSAVKSIPKPRRSGAVEMFLAVVLASLAASDSVDAATIDDLLDRFPVLIVFDGLDEVAQRQTRQRVVTEIEKFIGRWRGSAVPPKIVVTTRPNVSELPEPSPQRFETITLMKLDRELRAAYLRKWCAARGIASKDKRELMRSFDSRTAEPHIAQLAEHPMQLTILLYLLHLQGHSVPDKRTPLYDDYMKTFLNREAEKSASVRANRVNLEEVTAYLGWYLQGLAEQQGSNGRLSAVDLKTEIFRYLTAAQRDTGLVDALFTDVTDRVWALASKTQGTFEFDVQPVREFFAAKYLYEFASADKSDVLNSLIRRPFWFNTSRFFGGFAHANEVGGLVDGLADEFAAGRHPLAERVATWTLLADGVFSSKVTAQRRAVELLLDDLSVRLLLTANTSPEPLPTLPADRGSATLSERLLAAASINPSDAVSRERVALAASLGVDVPPLGQWWLDHARPTFGSADELAWFRLGEPFAAARLLEPEDFDAVALTDTATITAAVTAGLTPPPSSAMERRMVTNVLAGHCSDVVSPQTGLVADLVNALAPRQFLHLAKAEHLSVFELPSAHCENLMPMLKRQDAFRRLKKIDSRFRRLQQAMNTARRSPNTVAPWSDTAEHLRAIYGPCWLATDIAVIGAAIDPKTRRDLGPMNPKRSTFGPDIDYGRLVNDIRLNRSHTNWWLDQRDVLAATDRATWAYALVAVAAPSVVTACLGELTDDLHALNSDQFAAIMASSSRLGLSHVSRRLSSDLVALAVEASLCVGLLIAHHADLLDTSSNLLDAFTPEAAAQAARFGAAAWPALRVAGTSLLTTKSPDWLDALKAHGPAAEAGVAQGHLPEDLRERILNNSGEYPLQWVTIAEASRSQENTEPPLLAAANAWFDD